MIQILFLTPSKSSQLMSFAKQDKTHEAGMAEVSLKGHRSNIGGQARKAAMRTESLRRKRLRAELKAGAASGDEEVRLWCQSKKGKHLSQAKTKLEAMRQKERTQKRTWRSKKRAAAVAALRLQEARCYKTTKSKPCRPVGRTLLL